MLRTRALRIRAAVVSGGVVAMLVTLPLTSRATADTQLEIYDSLGIGRALELQFTIEPSIFTPLAQLGLGYSESRIDSRGGGSAYTLVSPTFPGKFAVGALGCFGAKGWVQAKYPPAGGCGTHQEDTFLHYPREGNDRFLTAKTGAMTADAGLARSAGVTTIADLELRPADANAPPFLGARDIRTTTNARRTESFVEQRVQTIVRDLHITVANVGITVDSIVSTATTRSDGTQATAETSFVLGDVHVTVGQRTLRARIDQSGVHVDDPAVKRDVALDLDRQITASLDVAGITLSVSSGTDLVEGPSAEASVGGLFLQMRAQVPPVRYPQEAAPILALILDAIPPFCFYDAFPPPLNLPLCFGSGVIPGPGTPMHATLAIASVQSRTIGLPDFIDPIGGGTVPPVDGGGIPQPADPVEFVDPGQPPPPSGGTARAPRTPAGPTTLLGLVARMPSAALAVTGVIVMILAFGIIVAPSLRP